MLLGIAFILLGIFGLLAVGGDEIFALMAGICPIVGLIFVIIGLVYKDK